jgi:hypothetical protein
MIKSRIKIYPKNENGYLILCGLDKYSKEYFYCIEPPVPIKSFNYECAKTFNIDIIKNLFTEKSKGNVIFISGNECIIYEYNGKWKKIKSINANLIKRHNKGGQSSLRFSRLAEESRLHYVTHCIDYINELCIPSNSYIYGSLELKTLLLDRPTLKIKLQTENIYHEFNNTTIYDKYFENIISMKNKLNEEKIYENIIEHIDIDPDILLFTENEINENINHIEHIIIIDKKIKEHISELYPNKYIIMLDISSKYYARLKDFTIIGKLFYKIDNIIE